MNVTRKLLNTVAGMVMLFGLAYCTYNFATAETRMREVCNQIEPGMTVEQTNEFAASHGLTSIHNDSGISFIAETKSFGRYSCKVVTEDGVVKESTYNFQD